MSRLPSPNLFAPLLGDVPVTLEEHKHAVLMREAVAMALSEAGNTPRSFVLRDYFTASPAHPHVPLAMTVATPTGLIQRSLKTANPAAGAPAVVASPAHVFDGVQLQSPGAVSLGDVVNALVAWLRRPDFIPMAPAGADMCCLGTPLLEVPVGQHVCYILARWIEKNVCCGQVARLYCITCKMPICSRDCCARRRGGHAHHNTRPNRCPCPQYRLEAAHEGACCPPATPSPSADEAPPSLLTSLQSSVAHEEDDTSPGSNSSWGKSPSPETPVCTHRRSPSLVASPDAYSPTPPRRADSAQDGGTVDPHTHYHCTACGKTICSGCIDRFTLSLVVENVPAAWTDGLLVEALEGTLNAQVVEFTRHVAGGHAFVQFDRQVLAFGTQCVKLSWLWGGAHGHDLLLKPPHRGRRLVTDEGAPLVLSVRVERARGATGAGVWKLSSVYELAARLLLANNARAGAEPLGAKDIRFAVVSGSQLSVEAADSRALQTLRATLECCRNLGDCDVLGMWKAATPERSLSCYPSPHFKWDAPFRAELTFVQFIGSWYRALLDGEA